MALIAVAADKGAPGVTTACRGAGRGVAAAGAAGRVRPGRRRPRLPAARPTAAASSIPGAGCSAWPWPPAAASAPARYWSTRRSCSGGLDVLVGVVTAEQGAGLELLWGPVGAALARLPGLDVIADCGRIGADGPHYDLLAYAAAVVLVTRATLAEVVRLRERVAAVTAAHAPAAPEHAGRGRGDRRAPPVPRGARRGRAGPGRAAGSSCWRGGGASWQARVAGRELAGRAGGAGAGSGAWRCRAGHRRARLRPGKRRGARRRAWRGHLNRSLLLQDGPRPRRTAGVPRSPPAVATPGGKGVTGWTMAWSSGCAARSATGWPSSGGWTPRPACPPMSGRGRAAVRPRAHRPGAGGARPRRDHRGPGAAHRAGGGGARHRRSTPRCSASGGCSRCWRTSGSRTSTSTAATGCSSATPTAGRSWPSRSPRATRNWSS